MSKLAPLTNPLIENNYFYLSSDGTYYIVGTEDYKKYEEMKTKLSGDVVIPEEYNGKPVKEIGKFSFYETNIKSLFVPDSIEKLFTCSSPFAENKLMESIRLSENILELPDNTFCGNKKLKYVKIPDSITRIPSSAFYNCENLSCVEFPNNLNYIGPYAFINSGLTGALSIPESVTSFNISSIEKTKNLTDIIFKGKPVFKNDHYGEHDVNMDEPIHLACTLDIKNIYAVEGKGWTGNETFMFGDGMCGCSATGNVFKPIEILPEGGATVAKNMTVKSMVFA